MVTTLAELKAQDVFELRWMVLCTIRTQRHYRELKTMLILGFPSRWICGSCWTAYQAGRRYSGRIFVSNGIDVLEREGPSGCTCIHATKRTRR